MVKEEKLTTEMWDFYNAIRYGNPKGYSIWFLAFTLKEKLEYISELTKERYFANTKLYRKYYNFKEAINNSSEVDKIIIIVDGFKFKIASEEEAMSYCEKLHDRGLDYLNREAFIKKKMRLDQQGKLLNNQYNELKPEDKQFHETYQQRGQYGIK